MPSPYAWNILANINDLDFNDFIAYLNQVEHPIETKAYNEATDDTTNETSVSQLVFIPIKSTMDLMTVVFTKENTGGITSKRTRTSFLLR